MPFFNQAHFAAPELDLFQLLSALDQSEQHQQKACGPRRHHRPQETFNPRFDVTEVADAYELFGEVAGLDSSNLSIEFSDAQTLVIKGKTERGLTSAAQEQQQQQAAASTEEDKSDAASTSSHKATVEDEYDEADTPLATPASTATAIASTSESAAEKQPQQQQAEQQQQQPKPKYWVSERKVGSFARSFSFSQRIEQDFVTASLTNGVLHVVVPKSLKSRKVAVSVN